MNINPLHPSHIIRRARNTQRGTKLAPLPARGIPHAVLQVPAILLTEGTLNQRHVRRVPVVADEPADEQLAAQLVAARGRQRVVQQHGVADRLVDDAVEDVREDFTL